MTAIIKKNGREHVHVSISEFKNRKFLDIRNYYRDAESGEWKPTPKGISIPVEFSKQLYKALKRVGEPFFDLLPPPGKEQEADEAINAKKAKQATGIQRRPKVVEETPEEFETRKKIARKEAKRAAAEIEKIEISKKKLKKIAKKVSADVLAEVDAKIAKGDKKKKKKKKVEVVEAKAKSVKHSSNKRPQLDDDEPVVKKKKKLKKKK